MNMNIFELKKTWANMNTIIQTDFCEYGYEYKFYHTHNQKKDVGMDKKATKVCKLMNLCTIIYNLWYLV